MSTDIYENIKEQIDRKYDLLVRDAYQVSEKAFFIGIADYVVIVSDITLVNEIIAKTVIEEQKKAQASLSHIATQAEGEIDISAIRFIAYAHKQKINDVSAVRLAIDEYRGLVSGNIRTSSPVVEAKFHRTRMIIEAIESLGGKHDKYAKRFLIPAGDGINTKWNFGSSFYYYQSEAQYFEDEKKLTVWGSWNELVLAFNSFFQAKQVKDRYKNASPSQSFEYVMGWAGLIGEAGRIMTDTKDPNRVQFKKEEYLRHLWRVHNHLLDQLSSGSRQKYGDKVALSPEPLKNTKDKNIKPAESGQPITDANIPPDYGTKIKCGELVYWPEAAKLQYGSGKPIDVNPGNQELKILKCLMDSYPKLVRFSDFKQAAELTWEGSVLQKNVNDLVQMLRSDTLTKLGIPKNKIAKIIKNVRNQGYKMIEV